MKAFTLSLLALAASVAGFKAAAQTSAPLNPVAFINQFEATLGKFEGYRRSNAKGICAMGEFVGTADARGLSSASVFSGSTIPVMARFSIGGANPQAADNTKSQRNMSLQFNLPNGEQWLMGNISSPVFGASSPEQFMAALVARQPDPTTKMPDAAKVKAFTDANPEVLLQGKHFASQPVPASFGSVNYWGVNAFAFVNASGTKQFGKWIFEPTGGLQGLTDDEAKAKGANFLFDDLRQRVKDGKVSFAFNVELAQAGDVIDNGTVPLPVGRKKVNLGTLKITSVSADSTGACVTTNFNPLVVPKGIEPSNDPLLATRASTYAVSLGRRLAEGAKQ